MTGALPRPPTDAETQRRVAALKRAILTLRGEVERSPKNGEAALALAEALFRLANMTTDPTERMKYLRRAVQLDPYDVRSRIAVARAAWAGGDVAEAVSALDAAAALAPNDAQPPIEQGLLLFEYARGAKKRVKPVQAALAALDRASSLDGARDDVIAVKLLVACFPTVSSPEKSPLLAMLPTTLRSLAPEPALVPFITCLGLSIAFALHHPRHAPPANAAERLTANQLAARASGLRALLDGLAPWFAAFPDDARLRMVLAAAEILLADEADLAARIASGASAFTDARLLLLFVHQKLEELDDTEKRVQVLRDVAQRGRLVAGLDRELLAALHALARAAVREGKLERAEAAWREGLRVDPYCRAFHHNLALLALHRRDAAALAQGLAHANDLTLAAVTLGVDPEGALQRLAAKHGSFAVRLQQAVAAAVDRLEAGSELDCELLAAWLGEAQARFIAESARVIAARSGSFGPAEMGEVLAFLRSLPAVADAHAAPAARLRAMLDAPLSGAPALHYEVLGVARDASAADVEKQARLMTERAQSALADAQRGEDADTLRYATERLRRVRAAAELLADPDARERYDRTTVQTVEHELHSARAAFVMTLSDMAYDLAQKKARDSIAMVVRAYRQMPRANLAAYINAANPERAKNIETTIDNVAVGSFIDHAHELLERENWRDAKALLEIAGASVGGSLRWVNYLLAVCEMNVEAEHAREHGEATAPGVPIDTGIAAKLAATERAGAG